MMNTPTGSDAAARATKWKVSSTHAEKEEIERRSQLAGVGRSAYVRHCCLEMEPPPRVRTALPPTAEERRTIEELLFEVRRLARDLRRTRRRTVKVLRQITREGLPRDAGEEQQNEDVRQAREALRWLHHVSGRAGELVDELLGRL